MTDKERAIFAGIDRLNSIARSFMGVVVLNAAAELELFTLLEKGPLAPAEVAQRLELDLRATEITLRALAGMELLQIEDGKFANSDIAAEFLVRGKPFYQGDILRHNGNIHRRWIELPQVLRTGRPAAAVPTVEDSGLMRDFILGMKNIAVLSAGQVAGLIDLAAATRLLDVGGGPGTYAIEFCRLKPELTATIFDLPQVIEGITAGQVKDAGLSDRINCVGGDYLKDELPAGFDLVLVSNIIHSLGERDNRLLFERCRKAILPGGRIVVKDFLLDDSRVTPGFASMFAVNMLTGTERGNCYTAEEVKRWLEETGFGGITYLQSGPRDRLLIGRMK
ncbi:MAG TPA: methyltransferase [Candidatus Glassbacteria bacterium]|nr:methyltransferase [Candidatus Glassbacteria bacterium]